MTTVYGSWTPNSSTNKRMRLRLEYSVPSPTLGQSSVTVTGTVYVEAGYSFYDANNTFSWSGALLGSGSTSKSIDVATGGSQQIHSFSKSVSLTSSRQSKSVSFSLAGIDYVGASNKATVSVTVTIPARAITAPATPSSFSASRISDTRYDTAWTATATTTQPIESFDIERYRLSEDSLYYVPAAAPSGVARAWVAGATPDDAYRWRIRARNAAGVSAWAYTDNVRTTPAAASDVVVFRTGSDATVEWSINALQASSQTLQAQDSTDGGVSWSSWADVPGHVGFSRGVSSRVVSGLDPTRVHRFRVVSTVTTPDVLSSTSGASNTLQLLTAPLAPSLTSLGTVSDEATTVLRWTHRPVDTTDQTAAEVEWRAAGASTWTTIAVTGNARETSVAAGVLPLGEVEWRVRTKGQHVDWSPWSAVGGFTVAQPPAVSIADPVDASTIASNRLTLTVAYTDPQSAAMTGWRAELLEGGQVIETLTGNGAVSSVTFATQLENLTSYSATFRATAGTGLQSAAASVSVSTDFLKPTAPTVVAEWDEPNGVVALAATTPAAVTHGWTGTAHASASYSLEDGAPVVTRTNWVRDPHTTSTAGWLVAGVATAITVDGEPAIEVTEDAIGRNLHIYAPTNYTWPVGTVVYSRVEFRVKDGTQPLLPRLLISGYHGAEADVIGHNVTPSQATASGDGWVTLETWAEVTAMPTDGHLWSILWPNNQDLPVGHGFMVRRWAVITGDGVEMGKSLPFFGGDTPSSVDPQSVRFERSDDDGASWTVVADDLPLGAGVGDDRVALNLDALYRAVSISELGVETEGASMPVTTASSRVWLQATGGKVHVIGNAQLAPTFDHEKTTERYIGRTLPTAHYGIGETVRVAVSGAWIEPDEIAQDVAPVLREDVWYRDPAGRAFWATVEGMSTPQPRSTRRDVSFTVEKVDVDG